MNDVLEEDLEHAARPLVDETPGGLDAATTGERVSDEGPREGWLATCIWLITERETGLGGSCIQLTSK